MGVGGGINTNLGSNLNNGGLMGGRKKWAKKEKGTGGGEGLVL